MPEGNPRMPRIGITCSTLALADMPGTLRHALPEPYERCVSSAEGLPLILPNVGPAAAPAYLDLIEGLVLSGGADLDPFTFGEEPHPDLGLVDPLRDGFEMALARGARERGLPILAICRGIQVLNVSFGGSLLQHIPSQVEGSIGHVQRVVRRESLGHRLTVVAGSRLSALAGREGVRANSFHHQAVGRLAAGFQVVARTSDGVIEAIEDPRQPYCLGVQWHPERCPNNALTEELFRGLIHAAREPGVHPQGAPGRREEHPRP